MFWPILGLFSFTRPFPCFQGQAEFFKLLHSTSLLIINSTCKYFSFFLHFTVVVKRSHPALLVFCLEIFSTRYSWLLSLNPASQSPSANTVLPSSVLLSSRRGLSASFQGAVPHFQLSPVQMVWSNLGPAGVALRLLPLRSCLALGGRQWEEGGPADRLKVRCVPAPAFRGLGVEPREG